MQFRLISAFFVFIGSYLPLAIILAIQDIPISWWSLPICDFKIIFTTDCEINPFKHPSYSLAFLVFSCLSTIFSRFIFKNIQYPFQVEIISAKSTPNDLINYVFPYVVSFMGVTYNEPEKLIGFGLFLLFMFAITYKSGQILMNPLLLMFGWQLYDATININNVSREVRILKQGLLLPGKQDAQKIQTFYIVRD